MTVAWGTGYIKGEGAGQRLSAHIKYVQYRSPADRQQTTPEDRRLFSKDEDAVSRHDAQNDIMEHADRGVAYHKIVLSPSDEEREGITDWQEWTRETMAELEAEKGYSLHWYAVHHSNTDHEHVHVVLAGRGEDEAGAEHQIRMSREDYKLLGDAGHEHSDIGWREFVDHSLEGIDHTAEINRDHGLTSLEGIER